MFRNLMWLCPITLYTVRGQTRRPDEPELLQHQHNEHDLLDLRFLLMPGTHHPHIPHIPHPSAHDRIERCGNWKTVSASFRKVPELDPRLIRKLYYLSGIRKTSPCPQSEITGTPCTCLLYWIQIIC